ncbi:hypothetical protein A3K78_03490 [Candidatus Bathyarchaeota archaeon RBG_13_52_12]|nr:MAG: hypothetical protein A3K78_03490 [Candidatus Bathyarchaeota archaeon RBG_13_52_12]
MDSARPSPNLLFLLNEATAREIQVSMQYMLQHALYSGGGPVIERSQIDSKAGKFVASHSPFFFPGDTLKKIAIAEMRHAEAIAERVSFLGGEPLTQTKPFKIGNSVNEILKLDVMEEETAIQLYNQIINVAKLTGDEVTERLFRRILLDEQEHHRIFTSLII